MRILENMFYEARPFIYALIGLYALFHIENKILTVCGLTLVSCSILVFNMRLSYRENMQKAKTVEHQFKSQY